MKKPHRHTPSARRVALDIWDAVTGARGQTLERALEQHRDTGRLEPRERAFVQRLVACTLRHYGQTETLLAHLLERPLPRRATAIHAILHLGLTQLLWMEIPPHAVVSSAATLARQTLDGQFAGLVNAVLRRADRERDALFARLRPEDAVPPWVWDAWQAHYGTETAGQMVDASLTEPPVDLSVREASDTWAARLNARVLEGHTLRLPQDAGALTELPGYTEGDWWVQDAAAAVPTRLLGDIQGCTVLDLCAAPGGKTAQLAAAGAQVIAVERSPRRLKRLRMNLERLKFTGQVGVIRADALDWRPDAPASHILLDAPCSATGTLRRHPEILLRRTPEDVCDLVEQQRALLAAAHEMLAPGGTLVYAVCSLQPEEGERQATWFLSAFPDMQRLPVTDAELGAYAAARTPQGDLRTLPCHLEGHGGMDGFFAGRFVRG